MAIGFVAVLALAACGDDDGDDGADPTDPTEPTDQPDPADEAVEVTAVDYAFEDLPESVAAGTRLELTNASDDEVHELVALRIPDDETRSVEELVALPEEEIDAIFGAQMPATVLMTFPGEEQTAAVGDGTLTDPGRYALVCFIPEGADPVALAEAMEQQTDGPPDVPGGPPHLALGMFAELLVE